MDAIADKKIGVFFAFAVAATLVRPLYGALV
jgi:hypothetical protein